MSSSASGDAGPRLALGRRLEEVGSVAGLASALVFFGGCLPLFGGGQAELGGRLAAAVRPDTLPLVVACWEKEFEGSQFQGGYVATVDFTVEAKTSRLRDAKVTDLTAVEGQGTGDPARFRTCLEAALNGSALPTEDGKAGPGFATSSDLAVTRYRIAFVDASSKSRTQANARQANVLLGPRADRCQGLYAHDPPRDASALSEAIAEGEGKAAYYRADNPDAYARELQKTYDSELELRDRLRLDLAAPSLPDANRKKIERLVLDLEAAVKKTGAKIGCVPPP